MSVLVQSTSQLGVFLAIASLFVVPGCNNVDLVTREGTHVRAIALMVEEYRQSYGHYPGRLEDAKDFFADAQFVDAWGHPLHYESSGPSFSVVSAGPDSVFGTGDDISRSERDQL
jgi:hypothetical protein